MSTVHNFNFFCKEIYRPRPTQLNSISTITREGVSKFDSDHKLFHEYIRTNNFYGTYHFPCMTIQCRQQTLRKKNHCFNKAPNSKNNRNKTKRQAGMNDYLKN